MNTVEFVQSYKDFKKQNIRATEEEISNYIKKTLEVKTYIPFMTKRMIAETIVEGNTEEVDGVWKNDAINQYISFVTSMLQSHTNLEIGENPMDDYDILAESELLAPVIATFQSDYSEADIILKMALAMKLEDNNINVMAGKAIKGIINILDVVGKKLEDFDLNEIINKYFNKEDLAKLSSFLNKLKK